MAVRLERLADLARHFPADAEIAIAADDRAATVTSGRSRFKLPVFPIADLLEPRILGEETGRVELDAKIARDLFARPAFAAADEASRPYLRGIFLHNTGDNLVAVAADGFRFCRVTTPATTTLSHGSLADHPERDGEDHQSPARQRVRQRDAAPIRTAVLGRGRGIRGRQHEGRFDLSRL